RTSTTRPTARFTAPSSTAATALSGIQAWLAAARTGCCTRRTERPARPPGRYGCGLFGRFRMWLADVALLQKIRNQEGEFDRLVCIETRIAMGMVAVLQIIGRDGTSAAGAFGNVLASHLDVDAARMRAFGAMNVEEFLDFLEDAVEGARLVARSGDGIAMHRVAGPYDRSSLRLHGAPQLRQVVAHLVRAKTGDERQAARLVLGVQQVDQFKQAIRRQRRPTFQAERVLDAAAVFDMSMVRLPGPVADPDHMARGRIPVATGG